MVCFEKVESVATSLPVILSEAKDLVPVASGDEVLRCAQDDMK
jgi:hypothetical protein